MVAVLSTQERQEKVIGFTNSFTETCGHDRDGFPPKTTLFEDYYRGELSIHIHVTIIRNTERAKFCLMMRSCGKIADSNTEFPVYFDGDNVAWSGVSSQNGYVNLPVLVSVCEGSESQQLGWHRVSPTLVRLQPLDNCNCLKRDSIEPTATKFIVERTMTSDDGKLMRTFCFLSWMAPQEEFANKIVETGVCGLENIAEHVGNHLQRRPASLGLDMPPNQFIRVVMALGNEPNVFQIDILRDCIIEEIQMMTCPV